MSGFESIEYICIDDRCSFRSFEGCGLGCSTCVAYRISRMLVWHSIVAKELEFTAWEGQADSDW